MSETDEKKELQEEQSLQEQGISETDKLEENIDTTVSEAGKKNKKSLLLSVVQEVVSWAFYFVVALAIAFVLNKKVIINAKIPSGSMENTIQEGDHLIGGRWAYHSSDPQRGDIVIFKFPDDETQNYIKRVIGLPGETVVIQDAKIYIDGSEEPLEEPYLKEEWVEETGPYVFEIPEDCYLVLGDNRNNSKDARLWENQYVKKDKILGKALFRYWPLNAIGTLD